MMEATDSSQKIVKKDADSTFLIYARAYSCLKTTGLLGARGGVHWPGGTICSIHRTSKTRKDARAEYLERRGVTKLEKFSNISDLALLTVSVLVRWRLESLLYRLRQDVNSFAGGSYNLLRGPLIELSREVASYSFIVSGLSTQQHPSEKRIKNSALKLLWNQSWPKCDKTLFLVVLLEVLYSKSICCDLWWRWWTWSGWTSSSWAVFWSRRCAEVSALPFCLLSLLVTHIFNHLPKAKHARQRMIFFFLIFSWSPSFFIHCTRKSKFMTNFRAWTRKLVLKCDFQLSSDYSFLFFCWIYDLSRWGWIDDLQRSTFVLNWVCWLTSDSDLQFDQQPARSPCREPVTFFLDGFTDLIQSVNTVRTQG